MLKKNPELWVGIVVLLFSIVFFITSFGYDYMSDAAPGPGFLPRWASGFLIICTIIYIVKSLKTPGNITILNDKKGLKKIINLFLALIVFAITLTTLGFTIACALMLFMIFRLELKWYTSLITAIITAVILFIVFYYWLMLPFPINSFGF